MDTLQNRISPKDAGLLGVQFFKDVMPPENYDRVLLEGLELDEDNNRWEVTVGFDTFRAIPEATMRIPGQHDTGSSIKSLIDSMVGKVIKPEIIREFRTVYLKAADGSFVKMDNR